MGRCVGDISAMDISHNYIWTISDFNSVYNETNANGRIVSPTFSTRGLQWCFTMFPKGKKTGYEKYAALYLRSLNSKDVGVKVCFSIMNRKNQKFRTLSFEGTIEQCKIWGSSCFIKQSVLMDLNNHILKDGKLTISIDITVANNNNTVTLDGECIHACCDFENLLNNSKFSDVKFIVDGREIFAHKNILSQRNEVFAAMFAYETEQNNEKLCSVKIENIAYEVVLEMLRFLYAKRINGINEIAKPLLIAADKYAIIDLKNMCAEYLGSNLDISNVIRCLEYADNYDCPALKTKAVDFVVSNGKLIDFKSATNKLSDDVIVDILERFSNQENINWS